MAERSVPRRFLLVAAVSSLIIWVLLCANGLLSDILPWATPLPAMNLAMLAAPFAIVAVAVGVITGLLAIAVDAIGGGT